MLADTWPAIAPLVEQVFATHIAMPAVKGTIPFLEKAFDACDLQPISDSTGGTCGVLITFIAKEPDAIVFDKMEVQRRLYDAITRSVPDLVYVINLDYKFVYANKALLEMWGRTLEQSIGQGLLALGYEPWHAEMHEREIDKVAATKMSIRGEVSFPHATLGERVYDYIFAPIFNENGEVELIAGTTRDISDLKHIEDALKQSEEQFRTLNGSLELLVAERTKELQRSNEDLLQFAHVASHDLKEPVRKIRTFANRLLEDATSSLSDAGRVFINKIENASERMYAMIEGVLRYSTMTSLDEDIREIDLNQILQQIESDLEIKILERKASIHYSGLPIIQGAPLLIHQLFYNLLNNSLKFVRKDVPPQITITANTMTSAGASLVKIDVTDNGIGFLQDHAETIFNTFTRLNTKDKYEGTGLGLSLCKKIVERHGGTITATATPDHGAVFSICLPVNPPA